LRRRHAQPASAGSTTTLADGTVLATAWTTTGTVVQDCTYRHDPAGNVLGLGDRAPGCGLPGEADPLHSADENSLDRYFSYDALDRLLTATGRENASAAT